MAEMTRCPRCGQALPDTHTTSRCSSCGYLLTDGEQRMPGGDALDSATRPAAPAAQFASPRFSDADNVDSQTRDLPAGATPSGSGAGTPAGGNATPQAVWPVASASAADALDAGTRPLPDQMGQPDFSSPVKAAIPQAAVAPSADPLLAPTADLPVHPIEPTQTLPPQAVAQPAAQSAHVPPAQEGAGRQRQGLWRTLSIAALVVVLLLVAVLGVLAEQGKLLFTTATPTATIQRPTATTGIPANFTTYTNAGHYRIAYPASWGIGQTNQTTLSLVILSYPPSAANMNIEYFKADTSQDLARQDDTFLNAFARAGTALQNKTAPTMVTIGDQQWTQEAADVTLAKSSLLAHVVAVSTMRGSYAYTIAYLAPATTALGPGAQFTQVDAAYFQPMLKTFTFLG